MYLLWEETAKPEHFPSLNHDIHTDVLIIGGGICGLLCAYALHQVGISYVLVEADQICGGVTKNTTAKITAQHGLIYQKLLKMVGPEKAKLYFRANDAALKQYALRYRIPGGYAENIGRQGCLPGAGGRRTGKNSEITATIHGSGRDIHTSLPFSLLLVKVLVTIYHQFREQAHGQRR